MAITVWPREKEEAVRKLARGCYQKLAPEGKQVGGDSGMEDARVLCQLKLFVTFAFPASLVKA